MQTKLEIVVEIVGEIGVKAVVKILSYTIALCNDRAEVQGVLSYPLLLSYSPWYLLRQ